MPKFRSAIRRRIQLTFRWWPTRFTIAGLCFGVITSAAFLWTALSTSFRAYVPSAIVPISVFSVLAAAWLKWSDKFITGRKQRKQRRDKRRMVNLSAASLLTDLPQLLRANTTEDKRRLFREKTLRCIKMIVSDLIDEVGDRIGVSLLDFSTGTDTEMVVIARSDDSRVVGLKYDSSLLIAYEAIKTGRPVVVDDVAMDHRWKEMGEKRYRSVVAVAVVHGGKAFGAVCIDSERPYDFLGLSKEVAIFIKPYVVGLALTFPSKAFTIAVPEDGSHLI